MFSKGSFLDEPFPGKDEPFSKQQILDSTELNEFEDDYFKFDQNDKIFSKGVEKE